MNRRPEWPTKEEEWERVAADEVRVGDHAWTRTEGWMHIVAVDDRRLFENVPGVKMGVQYRLCEESERTHVTIDLEGWCAGAYGPRCPVYIRKRAA